jgi:iron complex outermembrane receptor protein
MTLLSFNRRQRLLYTIALGALTAPLPFYQSATAQTQTAQPMAAKAGVEEIVVTARKKEERLQDIPLNVSAFTGAALERQGILGLKDIAAQTPGFVFQEFASSFNPSPTLRGLTQFNVSSAVANVSSFLDGIYLPRNYSVDLGVADVNRVEVVKGPQSALYGQNAFAGAINYVMEKPSDAYHAVASLTGGSAGRFDYKVAGGGPLIADKVAVRAFYARSQYDGTWTNNIPTSAGGAATLGGHDNESYGASARITPVSWLSADFSYFHSSRHEDIKPAFNVTSTDTQNIFNCGIKNSIGRPSLICGPLSYNPATYQSSTSPRPAGIIQPAQPGFNGRTEFYRAALHADVTSELSADYLFGHVRAIATEITTPTDNAVTPPIGLNFNALAVGKAVFGPYYQTQKEGGINQLNSHEGRLNWDHGPLKATAGFYYSENIDKYRFNIGSALAGSPAIGNAINAFDFTNFAFALTGADITTKSTAEFGRLSYAFLDDKAEAAVELRHNVEDKSSIDAISGVTQAKSFDTTTPRVTLDYKLAPKNLVYVSAAQGVKSGGFNGLAVGSGASRVVLLTGEQAFDPEENWTYEVGSKNTFMGGRLTVNADFFYVSWKNFQIQALPTNAPTPSTTVPVITRNIGNVTSYGFESDGSFAITEKLMANYALAIIEPTFDQGVSSPRFRNVCDNIACPTNTNISGKTLPRTSKQQFAAGLTWSDTVFAGYNYSLHGDVTYQSKQQAEEMNLAQIPARTLVNLSASLSKDFWEVTVWGKNVLNKKYVADSFFIVSGVGYSPSMGETATVGVTATARY